jgi:hydroxyethylthiazole kinase-like sugar kinase family protein
MLEVAAELAMPRASGPGSLQVEFLDRLYALESTQITRLARITIMA